MKILRFMVSGLVIGFLATLSPSCSGGKKCDATSCADGCCDASGVCKKPADQSANACGTGTGGASCAACPTGETCGSNKCSGNNGVSAICNASNCAGCCSSAGTCVPTSAQSLDQCGLNGDACAACTGNVCSDGVCGGQTSACDATWTGCCNGTTKMAGNAKAACGRNGAACVACPDGQECRDFACVTVCSAANCDGCCRNNECLSGTENGACGTGGGSCATCSGVLSCTSGSCQENLGTLPDFTKACTGNADCESLGAGFTCRTTTANGSVAYPGGVCTKVCSDVSECPNGSTCINHSLTSADGGTVSLYGETGGLCMAKCNSTKPCREPQYTCAQSQGSTSGFCLVNPPAPAGRIGSACADSAACAFPPTTGACIPAVASGQATGFVGGYCTADCRAHYTCGTTGVCVAFAEDRAYCLQSCTGTGQSTCRTGYVCQSVGSGSVCLPNCNNAPDGCGDDAVCNAQGYCQQK